jgi:hypothetical protein
MPLVIEAHGLQARYLRGDVAVVDHPDPDNPKGVSVRGMRSRCNYDTLHARGGLSDAEREAADRYAVLCERELGAQDRSVASTAGRLPPWMQGHPAMTQVQASAALRGAHAAVGGDGTALLRLYVRDGLAAGEIGKRRKETEAATLGRIKATLLRLAEHWGMEG